MSNLVATLSSSCSVIARCGERRTSYIYIHTRQPHLQHIKFAIVILFAAARIRAINKLIIRSRRAYFLSACTNIWTASTFIPTTSKIITGCSAGVGRGRRQLTFGSLGGNAAAAARDANAAAAALCEFAFRVALNRNYMQIVVRASELDGAQTVCFFLIQMMVRALRARDTRKKLCPFLMLLC